MQAAHWAGRSQQLRNELVLAQEGVVALIVDRRDPKQQSVGNVAAERESQLHHAPVQTARAAQGLVAQLEA